MRTRFVPISYQFVGVSVCTVLLYGMAPPGVPDDVTDLDDPTVGMNVMVNEVGAESVATVQAQTLRTRAHLCAAGIVLEDEDADDVDLRNLSLRQQMSDRSNYEPGSSSDGASVGAPTRAHRVNDRSAAVFDAFSQAMSNFTSQNVHNAAAIAKSDKPKWDVKTDPFHTYKRRVMIWAEPLCIEHLLIQPVDMVEFECQTVAQSASDTNSTADTTCLCEA